MDENIEYRMVIVSSITIAFIGLFCAAFILREILPSLLSLLTIILSIYVIIVPCLIYKDLSKWYKFINYIREDKERY